MRKTKAVNDFNLPAPPLGGRIYLINKKYAIGKGVWK